MSNIITTKLSWRLHIYLTGLKPRIHFKLRDFGYAIKAPFWFIGQYFKHRKDMTNYGGYGMKIAYCFAANNHGVDYDIRSLAMSIKLEDISLEDVIKKLTDKVNDKA